MELYPYLAELRDVISMITDYVKFLREYSNDLSLARAAADQVAAVAAACVVITVLVALSPRAPQLGLEFESFSLSLSLACGC